MGDAVTDEDGENYNTKTNSEVNARSGESLADEITVKIKSKKRVQFPPDGFLVRVREIPPRTHHYSSESDDSPEESSSESEDAESDTESDSSTDVDDSTESDSSSPIPPADDTQQTFIAVKTAPKPAPITKTTSPNSAPVVPTVSRPPQQKLRSTFTVNKDSPTPLFVKSDKLNALKTRTTFLGNNRKKPEINLPPSVFKTPKPVRTSTTTNILHQRRAKSAPIGKSQPIKRNYQSSVTTSLSVMPSTIQDEINSATESIQQTFQSISIGQLYTIDGFIFPSHQASELHLPKVIHATGSVVNTSPYTSSSDSTSALRQLHNKTFFSGNSGEPNSNHLALQQARQLNTKRRHYAWQMANGSAEQTLYKTPNIAQMWDSTSHTSAAPSDLNKNNLF